MSRPVRQTAWRCPGCGDVQRQPRATSVSHECPARTKQPLPAKGKRKLPLWVDYERIEEDQ